MIDGEPVPRKRLAGPCSYDTVDEDGWRKEKCVAFEERLGKQRYTIIHTGGVAGNMEETTVPVGHVFVLGDNRDNSHDSRFWGTVPVSNIKGRASIIWWSSGPAGLRTERFFTSLHLD